jgi:hypothetical protein
MSAAKTTSWGGTVSIDTIVTSGSQRLTPGITVAEGEGEEEGPRTGPCMSPSQKESSSLPKSRDSGSTVEYAGWSQ